MHGSYTHRVTCNLHPEQYFRLRDAAQKLHTRLAPFIREAALAYIDQRLMLPQSLDKHLRALIQEIRRVGTNLNQIAKRANTYQRLTHKDLKHAGKLVEDLERQTTVLRTILEGLPQAPSGSSTPPAALSSTSQANAGEIDES